MRPAVLAAGCSMVLLVLAASSAEIQVWRTPSAAVESPVEGTAPPVTVAAEQPESSEQTELPQFLGTLMRVVAGLVAILVVAIALAVVRFGRVPEFSWRPRRAPLDRGGLLSLPEVKELTVDIDSARTALSGGLPRNAIVACWMQLERDAADAGLPRLAAETPTEYVERVVGASSVDPLPIGELAALYREARFSRHELGDEHRGRALAALDRVEAGLRHGTSVPA